MSAVAEMQTMLLLGAPNDERKCRADLHLVLLFGINLRSLITPTCSLFTTYLYKFQSSVTQVLFPRLVYYLLRKVYKKVLYLVRVQKLQCKYFTINYIIFSCPNSRQSFIRTGGHLCKKRKAKMHKKLSSIAKMFSYYF